MNEELNDQESNQEQNDGGQEQDFSSYMPKADTGENTPSEEHQEEAQPEPAKESGYGFERLQCFPGCLSSSSSPGVLCAPLQPNPFCAGHNHPVSPGDRYAPGSA